MPLRAQGKRVPKLKPRQELSLRATPVMSDQISAAPPLQPSPTLQTTHTRPSDGTSDTAEVRDGQLNPAGRDPCAPSHARASHTTTASEPHVDCDHTMHKDNISSHAAPHAHGPQLTTTRGLEG